MCSNSTNTTGKVIYACITILPAKSKNGDGFLITANCSPEWKNWDKSASHTDFDQILKIIVRHESICTAKKYICDDLLFGYAMEVCEPRVSVPVYRQICVDQIVFPLF